MGSLWESLFSPVKNLVSPRRLRKYGNILCDYLKNTDSKKLGASQVEAETKSLQNFKEVERPGNILCHYLKNTDAFTEVERIIGYRFNDHSLLYQAFTHQSYFTDCISHKRLMYLGDSILNLLMTKELFTKYPNFGPGLLTPLRAANVDAEKLARVAVRHNFHSYIRFETPLDRKKIQTFIDSLPEHPLHSYGLINAPKVLADVVESTIGAVFVDSNYSIDTTWEVARDLMEPIITPEMLEKNPMKKLNELCRKHKLKVKLVDLWSEEGTYKVYVEDKLRGTGTCHSKKGVALNRAANTAYNEVLLSLSPKILSEDC